MNLRKKLLLFILCFTIWGLIVVADDNLKTGVEKGYFIYHYDNEAFIPRSEIKLNETRIKLISILNDTLNYKPAVYLIEEQQRFDQITQGRMPDWGIAVALPERKLIALKAPDKFNLNRSLEELLAHEYSHLAIAHRVGFHRVPRWLNEGMAMYTSMEWSWSDNLAMSRAAVFGQLLNLIDIEKVNQFSAGKAQLSYAESYLAVDHFIKEFGLKSLNIFLDQIAAGETVNNSFITATGYTYQEFDDEFKANLMKRYNIVSLFMDTILFWLFLAVLVIVGGFMKFKKRREYFKRWEEEEKLHSTDFDYGDPDNPEKIDDDEPWRS